MKKIILFSISMMLLFLLVNTTSGCKKDDPKPVPDNLLDTIPAVKGKLFINEIFSKSNATPAINDWVELYNSSDSTLMINDVYTITDTLDFTNKFLITKSYYIAPKSFFVIECDGLNVCSDQIHSSFKLTSSGEQFGIYNGTELIDTISFPDMSIGDISYGRSSDGANGWTTFSTPTKGASNN